MINCEIGESMHLIETAESVKLEIKELKSSLKEKEKILQRLIDKEYKENERKFKKLISSTEWDVVSFHEIQMNKPNYSKYSPEEYIALIDHCSTYKGCILRDHNVYLSLKFNCIINLVDFIKEHKLKFFKLQNFVNRIHHERKQADKCLNSNRIAEDELLNLLV